MKKIHAVQFFRKYLDKALNNTHRLLLAGMLVLIIVNFHQIKLSITKWTAFQHFSDQQLSVLLTIVSVIGSFLIDKMICLLKKFISINTFLKHKLYLNAWSISRTLRNRKLLGILNAQVNVFYYISRANFQEQANTISKIFKIIHEEKNSVLWLVGNSYSGKTTIVTNFLIDMISQNSNYKLFLKYDGKIIYIDLARRVSFAHFLKKYNQQKYQHHLIIVDNIHALSDKDILKLYSQILLPVKASLILICTRVPEELSTNPLVHKVLKQYLNNSGEVIEISSVVDNWEKTNAFSAVPKELATEYTQMNDIVRMHYTFMLNRASRYIPELISKINKYILGLANFKETFFEVLVACSIICLFTGVFTSKQIEDCFVKKKQQVRASINDLYTMGFINRSISDTGCSYCLNKYVARYYYKISCKYSGNCRFRDIVITSQYQAYLNATPHVAFLYSCLGTYSNDSSNLFDRIAPNANFKTLLEDMLFVLDATQSSAYHLRELGILYDRTGNIQKAREAFTNLLQKPDQKNKGDAFYGLVQVNHQFYKQLNRYSGNIPQNMYFELLGDYWKLHINMHKGMFDVTSFVSLLRKCQNHYRFIVQERPYDGLHFLRRIYFDTYRVFYLDGSIDSEILLNIHNSSKEIEAFLRAELDEFPLYYKKFTQLLLLSKNVLFNLAVSGKIIDKSIFELFLKKTHLHYEDMGNLEKIVEECIAICLQLEAGFDAAGDKTKNFILYYRAEMLLIGANWENALPLIQDYIKFGKNEIEYNLYADFLLLKYKIRKAFAPEHIACVADQSYEVILSDIYAQMNKIEEYFSHGYLNYYAKMRLNVYRFLMDAFSKQKYNIRTINKYLAYAKQHSYHRETQLIHNLQKMNYKVSVQWLRDAMLYYPIVPQ